MQSLASHAPEMKKLQERYKNDKERLNQEMMKFYRENKINPLASCLPLLAQLPVFLSLFYMLRKDLRIDICPEINPPGTANPVPCGEGGDAGFLFIPDLTDKATGYVLVILIVLYVGSQLLSTLLMSTTTDRTQRIRRLHHQLPGRPARLLDHDEPVDDRAAGDHPQAPRSDPTTRPGLRHGPG
jgi:YidC/Oxa1 family membrane protein insertase